MRSRCAAWLPIRGVRIRSAAERRRNQRRRIVSHDASSVLIEADDLRNSGAAFHMITVESASLFKQWMERKTTLEEIIGTRRFTMYRSPDIYDKAVLRLITTEL